MTGQPSFLPVHRGFLLALVAAFGALLAWSWLAEIDIVATAQGKLEPAGFVQSIQPAENGVVRRVLAKDGDQVAAGQPLAELDPAYAGADVSSTASEREALRLRLARIEAELEGLPFLPTSSDSALLAAAVSEYEARRKALQASLSEADAALRKAHADQSQASARYAQASQLLPMVAKQSAQQQELRAQGFLSEAAALDKDKELLAARQDQTAQASAVSAASAALEQAAAARERVLQAYRQQLTAEQTQAQEQLAALSAEQTKHSHRLEQLTLRAPVSGTVNGIAKLAPGQVVNAGQTVMSLVPAGQALQFDGWLRNEDAAFVTPGMPVRVKAAAYPFQKYGWVDGTVAGLGVDSEVPESMRNVQGEPLFYRMRVELSAQALSRNGETFALKPGMQAIADVQIGTRTLAEYLTSPLRKVALEAARER